MAITFNTDNETDVLWIDTKTLEATKKRYYQSVINCIDVIRSRTTAFLLDKKLFQMKFCPAAMAISITDVQSGERMAEWKYMDGEEITLADVIISNDDRIPKPGKESRRFFNLAGKGVPTLSAYQVGDTLHLTVGSVDRITEASPPRPSWEETSILDNMPSSVSWLETLVTFHSRLDAKTLEHHAIGPPATSIASRIEELQSLQSDEITGTVSFRHNDRFILAYYKKDGQKLVLREFK